MGLQPEAKEAVDQLVGAKAVPAEIHGAEMAKSGTEGGSQNLHDLCLCLHEEISFWDFGFVEVTSVHPDDSAHLDSPTAGHTLDAGNSVHLHAASLHVHKTCRLPTAREADR